MKITLIQTAEGEFQEIRDGVRRNVKRDVKRRDIRPIVNGYLPEVLNDGADLVVVAVPAGEAFRVYVDAARRVQAAPVPFESVEI